MRSIGVSAVLIVLCFASTAVARQNSLDFGRWKNYTDMKAVRGVAVSRESLWAATSGGLFLYTPSANHFAKFTNSEGLSSNDLTAITIDGQGRVWVGSSDGFLDVFDPHTKEWREVRSIKDSDKIQKGIRAFSVRGDSLLIGTDFGVTVFLLSRFEFRDTYTNFGFASQAKVTDLLIQNNQLWVATDLGVAAASLSAPNLSSPSSWTKYETSNGLPSNNITSLAVLRDTVAAGTASGVAYFDGASFRTIPSLSGKQVADLAVFQNDLIVLWNTGMQYTIGSVLFFNGSVNEMASDTLGQAAVLAAQSSSATMWVGTSFAGLTRRNGPRWEYIAPDGPQSNLFISITVDDKGRVWAASGISGRGQGFYRLDPLKPEGSQWKNFASAKYPTMGSGLGNAPPNDYFKVSLGNNGSVWASSWGRGVVEVKEDSILRRLDTQSTPALSTSDATNPDYPVIGSVAVDSRGNSWIANWFARNKNHLVRLRNDTIATYYSAPSSGLFTNMVIDRNNTKWMASAEPWNKPPEGLYYFNEDTLVTGTRLNGGWGRMTSSDGFPSGITDYVLSVAVDLEGDVCVGTDNGMIIITEPLNPKASRINVFPLRGQVIQSIAVDAVNNKWVGTKEGVIVVNSDGTQVLAQHTVLSTGGKLVDNDVRSIAIDQKRGIAYFGTEKGLSSLEIIPVRANRAFTTLEFGPNPFLVPTHQQLTIRNLVEDCSIKILSINGTLVSEFKAQGGGRAFWDGRDKDGRYVSSGVYFVVAFAENGNQLSTGKIAVVRR